jgi:hypothetical protein
MGDSYRLAGLGVLYHKVGGGRKSSAEGELFLQAWEWDFRGKGGRSAQTPGCRHQIKQYWQQVAGYGWIMIDWLFGLDVGVLILTGLVSLLWVVRWKGHR